MSTPLYLYALCHPEGGGVLECKIGSEKIEDPISLALLFSKWDRTEGDCFRVIKLDDVDLEYLPNLEALLSLTGSKSGIGEIVDHLFCDLLTSGMRLQQATPIPRH